MITLIITAILLLGFWQYRTSMPLVIIFGLFILIVASVFIFAWTLKLTFTANDRFISLRIKYLQTRAQLLRWEDIDRIWQADINAVKDFGGWGLRYNSRSTGYIFRSTTAIFFKTKQGQEIAVTTGRGSEFMDMIAATKPELLNGR